ncbi:NAD(P)/FAD-dependent oxidoreductase [Haliovirga abyssi]|uniref:Thioredoxin reductase n=1 Tax=Haliovirga abyssi TaxID=2996794 RepID=A0AAU9DGJ4_9FUSO|nr:FAD-dependent oxidoreductase [Haliovirga abyssi]BDU50572.1 thioredoxin reductase [Haliovirga abyssi]
MDFSLGLNTENAHEYDKYDVVIIGGGPAGLSAALYTARANFSTLVIEKENEGALLMAHQIDNYIGFDKGHSGKELYENMKNHAKKFGVDFKNATLFEIDPMSSPKTIKTSSQSYQADAIIVATGKGDKQGKKYLGEEEYLGKGVSYCATCDGAFFKDMTVSVFGNGDEAAEEALFLTRYASKVLFFIKEDEIKCEPDLKNSLESNEKIELITNANLEEIKGTEFVEKVIVNIDGDKKEYDSSAAFLYLGTKSSLDLYATFAKLDSKGFIETKENMETLVEGIYAAGDIRKKEVRQVVTAASDGAIAGISAVKHLMKIRQK